MLVGADALTRISGPVGWVCERLDLDGDDRLTVRFCAVRARDWVEITVEPIGAPGPVFRRFEHCQVRYKGQLAVHSDERKEDVVALVLGVAGAVESRLAADPRASIARALGREDDARRLVFGPLTLRELLAPHVLDGVPTAGGWVLSDVYPAAQVRALSGDGQALVLDFRRADDGTRALFQVARRADDRPAFAHTTHLSISYLALGAREAPGVESLRALVSFALQLHDHPRLELTFPATFDEPAALALGDAAAEPGSGGAIELTAPDEVLNLAISSECHQQCAFCSVKETAPAEDGGERTFVRLCNDLYAQRRRGLRALRLNGYDPLTFSRILEVMRLATKLGFERAEVFSPCTRLADEAFAEELVAALPPKRQWYVPLYGVDAATHDQVVGRPGAFALVKRALENLRALSERDISLLAVVTRDNVDAIHDLAVFAHERELNLCAHLPYPSFESRADRYFTATPRQTDVVAGLLRGRARSAVKPPLGRLVSQVLEGVAPCVTFRAMRAAQIPVKEWLRVPEHPPALPGTEYRDPRYRHRRGDTAFSAAYRPCPHADRCSLLPACAGEVLRGYEELHGLDELVPVSLGELLEAT